MSSQPRAAAARRRRLLLLLACLAPASRGAGAWPQAGRALAAADGAGGGDPQLTLVGRFLPGAPKGGGAATLPQLFTWSGSSISVSFSNSRAVALMLDSRMSALPAEHALQLQLKKGSTFPNSFWRVRGSGCSSWGSWGLQAAAAKVSLAAAQAPAAPPSMLPPLSAPAPGTLPPPAVHARRQDSGHGGDDGGQAAAHVAGG